MKFIDELDIERVNQTLNFETNDCKITGGCDIYTTKPVASDKKLYKTIDHHLETILQENESYNAAIQQQIAMENNGYLSPSPFSGNGSNSSRRDSTSFWEQKRRMSITDPIKNFNNLIQETNNSFNNQIDNNRTNSNDNTNTIPNNTTEEINSNDQNFKLIHGQFPKSSKLNDQYLKELVLNSENNKSNSNSNTGYLSSSSIESNHTNPRRSFSNNSNSNKKFKRTNSSSSLHSNHNTKSPKLRRSSLNDTTNSSINIGPFGPINEPASRRTFAYLIGILNSSYPDHDFSSLEPTDFTKHSLKSFISKFENSLYSLGKKPEDDIWEIINSHMTMSDCIVYQYNPSKSFLEDEPGYLWSLMGFLFNKKRKRVAFIYLISSRLKNDEFDRFSFSTRTNNNDEQLIINDDNDQFEGEYDLRIDENAIADDSEDDYLSESRLI